jgi:AbiV family abortive infection protein
MVIIAKRLPDEREAVVGAEVATATATSLLSGADRVAGDGSYGIARSLAVLALEESVKARTLGAIAVAASHGDRPGFSDEVLRKVVYRGHRERHDVGFVQHVAATFPDAYGKIMLGMSVDAEEAAKITEVRGLLAEADTVKQAGFYSDFDPDSGSWSSPSSVTGAEFTKVRVLIGDYVAETQRQFDEFMRYRTPARQEPAGS